MTKRITDTPGVAAYTTISTSGIRRMVLERRIPFIKMSKLVRFDLDAIDRWLESQAVSEASYRNGRGQRAG